MSKTNIICANLRKTKELFQNIKFGKNISIRSNDENGIYKESIIIPSPKYPLPFDDIHIFSSQNTAKLTDDNIIAAFDSVEFQIGRCYTNIDALIKYCNSHGINGVKSYVGWLVVGDDMPVHHCWAVYQNSVLDFSSDFRVFEYNLKHNNISADNLSSDDLRGLYAEFHNVAVKQPNSLRCAPVGTVSDDWLYIGCECSAQQGLSDFQKLWQKYPNHECVKNSSYGKGISKIQGMIMEKEKGRC